MTEPQLFPIYGRFVGDFVPHLVAALTSDTMPELAQKVAVHSVGRRLPARPGGRYDVVLDGTVVPDEVTLGELVAERKLAPLTWFDVRWRD
jgi:toluene monooxygenase system protein B